MAELLSRKEVRARKGHICDLCKAKIETGAMYVRSAYEDGGKVYDFKQHIHCDYLADSYCASMGCDEYDNGDVEDWVFDEVCRDCADREDCITPTLLCPVVIKALLPPTLQTHEEVKRYTEGGTVS